MPRQFVTERTSLGKLHSILSEMLAKGIDPDTPVCIRPKTHDYSPEPELPLGDVWYYEVDGVIFLDEVGV